MNSKSFPYKAPSKEIYNQYLKIFNSKKHFKLNVFKRIIDIFVSFVLLIFFLPILIIIFIFSKIENLFDNETKGEFIFYYKAVSAGKIFKKYKIRIIKKKYIDEKLSKQHLWEAYNKEWNQDCLSIVGRFVKKFYLDEIPQFFNILKGDISLVGPRSLAIIHYDMEINQGNIYRKYIKAGLLGYGHLRKGTEEMGKPEFEHKYVLAYTSKENFKIIFLDFYVIFKSILLILKGGGH